MKKLNLIILFVLVCVQVALGQSYQFTKVADLPNAIGVVFNSDNEMFYFSQGDNLYNETGTNLLGSTGLENVSIGVENETIWVGGYWGITKYDAGNITTYTSFPAGGGVYDIDYFQNNVFLAKEEGGLCYFDGIDWHESINPTGGSIIERASCVTHDDNGNLYVGGSDASNSAVIDVFDGNSWYSYTEAEHGISWPRSILIDSNDNLWVIGANISMFDGSIWTQFGSFSGNVSAIEEDTKGNIWIASRFTTNVYKYDGSSFDLITSPENCSGRTNGFALNQFGELFITLDDGVYRIEELDGNSITTYNFTEQTAYAVIDYINYTINIEVVNGTDLTNLVAVFTTSVGATATVGGTPQLSGTTSNDFTNPVTYIIESGTGTTQDWTVIVTEALLFNDENDILSFNIPGQVWAATIDEISHSIEIKFTDGTNLTSLVANVTLSDGAKTYVGAILQVSGVTPNDFTNPLMYIVEAEDGTVQNWTINITSGIKEYYLPSATKLEQNYPNPFNPVTQIKFALPSASEVKLNVLNINGQLVSELVNEIKEAGIYTINFDASNYNSGIYFYTIEANGMSITKKMILTK